jgi:hypothetical protein
MSLGRAGVLCAALNPKISVWVVVIGEQYEKRAKWCFSVKRKFDGNQPSLRFI